MTMLPSHVRQYNREVLHLRMELRRLMPLVSWEIREADVRYTLEDLQSFAIKGSFKINDTPFYFSLSVARFPLRNPDDTVKRITYEAADAIARSVLNASLPDSMKPHGRVGAYRKT
jgi:hypothetical protein